MQIVGITSATHALAYYTNGTYDAAQAAKVTATTTTDKIVFTAESAPTTDLVCDITYWEGDANGNEAHIIKNASGTTFAQRANLQFGAGLSVTDDSTNNATVVEVGTNSVTIPFMTKLWENPDPTAEFAPQNITLASNDYDFLYIVCRMSTSIDREITSLIEAENTGFIITTYASAGGINMYQRTIQYTSKTVLSATDAYKITNGAYGGADNTIIIPVVIYGLKKSYAVEDVAIANVSTSATQCIMSDNVTTVEQAINAIKTPTFVSVTADGVKTYSQLFDELYALVDKSKVTNNSILVFDYHSSSGSKAYYQLSETSKTFLVYSKSSAGSSGARVEAYVLQSSGSSYLRSVGSTQNDLSSTVCNSGWEFIIYY